MKTGRCRASGRRLAGLCPWLYPWLCSWFCSWLWAVLAIGLGAAPAAAQSTLELVKKRGTLICGVNGELRGFSSHVTGSWMGLDVDMCRAVAAAALGDANQVAYVPLTAQERFGALQAGQVDLLARNKQAEYTTLPETISREPLGPFVRYGDDPWAEIVRWSFQAMLAAEELDLRRDNVQGERQSHDPEIRRLLGVAPGNGRALGLDEEWAFNIIAQVGNYGESFERNVASRSMLKLPRGANALWTSGGLMYPLPMR